VHEALGLHVVPVPDVHGGQLGAPMIAASSKAYPIAAWQFAEPSTPSRIGPSVRWSGSRSGCHGITATGDLACLATRITTDPRVY